MNSPSKKLAAGSAFPDITLPTVGGGELSPATQEGWRMVVVYRGKHCPLCKQYLDTLNGLHAAYRDAGIPVMAVSGDPLEKADAPVSSQGLAFAVGYDLSVAQMIQLGLYVSEPRSTDRPFPEPGLFVINPDNQLQIIDVSNAPFARPDLASLLDGLKFIQDKDYPIRGTLVHDAAP
jgi:peroxiredoxin